LPTSNSVLLDDRLLIALLIGARVRLPSRASIATTAYWYYRARRAAVLGGTGQLSGPFQELAPTEQAAAIEALLQLPEEVGLPDPRLLVPEMVRVHRRHHQLNLLNLEAAAAVIILAARVLLSPRAAEGILPGVLDAEGIAWRVLEPAEGRPRG
jgi:hypothetical protein